MIKTRRETMKLKSLVFAMLMSMVSVNADSNQTSTEDFFYQRGYEAGFNNGFEIGVQKALEESRKMLALYANEIQAYEIGKYLIKSKNLTYPQVWQEQQTDGSVKIRIMPSKLEKQLNIDEIFAKFGTIPTIQSTRLGMGQSGSLNPNAKNSIYLSTRDSNFNKLPQNVNQSNNKFTLSIEKSSKNLDILKKANVVFSDEGENYNVLFFTKTEKLDFCNQYEICDGE